MSGVNKDSSSVPLPCANGCGFYGSSSTNNMCSKCFREYQKRETSGLEEAEVVSPAQSTAIVEVVPPTELKESTPAPNAEQNGANFLDDSTSPGGNATEASKLAEPEEEKETPKRRVQKNTSRCWECRKKIGLMGFKCQCGYVFCGDHRYSDKHECDFDWKARAQEHLSKANPVVKADKVQKI